MVDRSQLAEVNNLYREWSQIEQALLNLDGGGRINSMVIVGATPDVPSAIVSTSYMEYPQQMVDAIKLLMGQRKQEIKTELEQLGLTGMPTAINPQLPTVDLPSEPKGRKK